MMFVPSTETTYATATSYLSVEDADMLMGMFADSGDWDGYDVPTKQALLNRASVSIDGVHSWQGSKTDGGQLLKFPRKGHLKPPQAVKMAVVSLLGMFARDEAFKGVTYEQIGKMSWTFGDASKTIGEEAMMYLRPFKMKSVRVNA